MLLIMVGCVMDVAAADVVADVAAAIAELPPK